MSLDDQNNLGGAAWALRAHGLRKSYPVPGEPGRELELFRDLQLKIRSGEMVAIVGQSGVGKSSLLHLLAGLDQPSAGEVWIRNAALHGLPPARLAELRNTEIGFVWQFHYLLPEFSALENVALPLLARGERRRAAEARARRWLDRVGLAGRAEHRSGELSGGEQQRVAMARALVTGPAVLLADEPTGDLDDRTAGELFALLNRVRREEQLAVAVVTHDAGIARGCDRVLRLVDGRLQPVIQES